VLAVLAWLAIYPSGIASSRDNQRLAANEPAQAVEVVSSRQDWSGKAQIWKVYVVIPSSGRKVEVIGGGEISPHPHEGDRIRVVVDPGDPESVLAADVDYSMSVGDHTLGGLLALFLAGVTFT